MTRLFSVTAGTRMQKCQKKMDYSNHDGIKNKKRKQKKGKERKEKQVQKTWILA